MPFYVLAWIAGIFYGFESIIGKLTTKYSIKNPWLFNFIWSFVVLLIQIPPALAGHVSAPHSWNNLILASIFSTSAGIFFILSIYHLDASVLSPLFNFRTIYTVLISTIFLGDILTTNQYILIALIVIAGTAVTLEEKTSLKSFFKPGLLFTQGLTLSLAIMGIYINKALSENSFWTVSLFVALLSQIFLLPTIVLFIKDIKKTPVKKYTGVIFMAVAGALGTLFSTLALDGNVSISTTIMSIPFSLIIAFLLSFIFPDLLEKHTVKVYIIRFVCAAVIIFSALRLSS